MDRKLDDATLMRYLDGELGRDEARDAERAVAADPELSNKVKALGQLGQLVHARYDHAADEVDDRLAALWDKIQPQLESRPAAAAAATKPERGFWDWFAAYRSHFLTGAVAAAAGALIATFAAGRGGPERPPAPLPIAVAAEVESLEVADGSATVLQLPGERAGETTTMIWITPAPAGTGNDENEGPI